MSSSGEGTAPSVSEGSGAPQGPGEVPGSIAVSGIDGFAGIAGESLPALREDQIGNAVVFLSHPKVRGAAAPQKRTFLKNKGLTEAEIDEAFRRVPDQPALPSAAPLTAPTASQPFPVSTAAPPRKPFHAEDARPLPPPPGAGVVSQAMQPAPPQQGMRWTQVVISAGVLAAAAYGLQHLLAPYIHRLYERIAVEPARARAEARREAHEVAEAIKAQSADMRAAVEAMREAVAAAEAREAGSLTPAQMRQELQGMRDSLAELLVESRLAQDRNLREVTTVLRTLQLPPGATPPMTGPPSFMPNGSSFMPNGPSRPSPSPPYRAAVTPLAPTAPPPATPPASFPSLDTWAETASRDHGFGSAPALRVVPSAGDQPQPPNPNQPPSEARLPVRAKPWERDQGSQAASSGVGPSWLSQRATSPPPAFARPTVNGGSSSITITEVDSGPNGRSAMNPAAAPWRPPPMPQPTISSAARPRSTGSPGSPAGFGSPPGSRSPSVGTARSENGDATRSAEGATANGVPAGKGLMAHPVAGSAEEIVPAEDGGEAGSGSGSAAGDGTFYPTAAREAVEVA